MSVSWILGLSLGWILSRVLAGFVWLGSDGPSSLIAMSQFRLSENTYRIVIGLPNCIGFLFSWYMSTFFAANCEVLRICGSEQYATF